MRTEILQDCDCAAVVYGKRQHPRRGLGDAVRARPHVGAQAQQVGRITALIVLPRILVASQNVREYMVQELREDLTSGAWCSMLGLTRLACLPACLRLLVRV